MSLLNDLREKYQRFRSWQQNPFDFTNRSEHVERCANCGTEFNDNFCPRCGQKAGVGPISWHTVRQGLTMIWGMDSRSLGYSLVQLVLRPGYLISDYINGKRQVSFPPVKMLLIVAIGIMIEEFIFGEPFQEETANAEAGNQALGAFDNWANANPGWAMMVTSCLFILPTWIFFRYAPKNPHHTLPEGFFIQVFMASLLILIAIITAIVESRWVLILMFIYYFFTYHQLFGYGWWGTLWRTGLCIFFGVCTLVMAEIMGNVVIGAPHEDFLTITVLAMIMLLMALIGYFIERRNKKNIHK